MILKPFQHDCDRCIWVGWVSMHGRHGNMYFCPSPEGRANLGSVVVRFSDRVDDYWSLAVHESGTPCNLETLGTGRLSYGDQDMGEIRR